MGERTNISKDGSISVPSYGNSRQNSGTNITKHLGRIRAPLVLLPTERRNEKSREYRHVERQRRVCSPVCTVQQKNREGNQHSHFCSRSINQFHMGMANGELVVMCATSPYHMYSGIQWCDLAHATNKRPGGRGIQARPPYLKRKSARISVCGQQ